MTTSRFLVAMLAIHLCLLAGSSAAQTTNVLELEGLRVLVGPPWKTNLRIEVDGIPFTDSSLLYALRPGEAGRYYGYEDDGKTFKRSVIGSTSTSLRLQSAHGEFAGNQRIELLPGRRMRIEMDARLTTDVKSIYEHKIGGVFSYWIAGRPARCIGCEAGVSEIPAASQGIETPVARGIRKLEIESPLGPLSISVSGTIPIDLVDYRQNRFRNFDTLPIFYLNTRSTEITSASKIQYSIEFQFPAKKAEPGREITTAKPKPAIAPVLDAAPARRHLVPYPKQVKWAQAANAGSSETVTIGSISISGDTSPPDANSLQRIATRMQQELKDYLHVEVPIRSANATSPEIRLQLTNAPLKPDGYRLNITRTGAVLEANTTVGLSLGSRTIRQLWQMTSAAELPLCEIVDWPSMPLRAIHFYGGRGGKDAQVKMLRDVLGPLKINAVLYDCASIRWDLHPELYTGNSGMPKADALEFVREAQRQDIQVIPLINTFGHSNWFLEKPQYRHLADDPANPFAYDPTKPEVYKFTESIYGEAADLFKPQFFHIGHDEITLKGFPKSEHLQRIGARKLILDDIRHYRNFFAERGIRTVIWADMFIAPGEAPDFALAPTLQEAKLRRAGLPKDVVLCDWHYRAAEPEEFVNLGILNAEGFDVWACPWYHPRNLVNYSAAVARQQNIASTGKSLGIVQATWAGSTLSEKAIQQQPDQFSAYVLGAEAAWNGDASPNLRPGEWDHRDEFQSLWNAGRIPSGAHVGWELELTGFANSSVPGSESSHPSRRVAPASGKRAAIELGSAFTASDPRHLASVVIPCETTASALIFLHAATLPASPDSVIAETEIVYQGGQSEKLEWFPGRNVYSLSDNRSSPAAFLVQDAPEAIHATVWNNPRPEKRIREIRTRTTYQGSGFILVGVRGVTGCTSAR